MASHTKYERQRKHRRKKQVTREEVERLIEALTCACERGRSTALTNRLPEDTWEAVAELTRRLGDRRLIVCRNEE